ncbi:MAG: NADH-quinone oxidoreductase subunit NuoK [Pirellulaceae bacterium]|nr:NADH-quinone oxidoreductase subunit NuoK [Pirellulaceae bacterium]MDP7016647.1 NADH-quinone oxidoreductase subunit NuoK [Pirellulaceae bacterium]
MNESALLSNYLLIGGLLFALGAAGFVVRRNMIVIFLCCEMMLQGVSITLIGFGRFHNFDWGGQMLVIFIIAIAACEAAIALAMILMLFQKSGTLDMTFWQDLREPGRPAFRDDRLPEESVEDRVWPSLTPAGVEPAEDLEEQLHRSRV